MAGVKGKSGGANRNQKGRPPTNTKAVQFRLTPEVIEAAKVFRERCKVDKKDFVTAFNIALLGALKKE